MTRTKWSRTGRKFKDRILKLQATNLGGASKLSCLLAISVFCPARGRLIVGLRMLVTCHLFVEVMSLGISTIIGGDVGNAGRSLQAIMQACLPLRSPRQLCTPALLRPKLLFLGRSLRERISCKFWHGGGESQDRFQHRFQHNIKHVDTNRCLSPLVCKKTKL